MGPAHLRHRDVGSCLTDLRLNDLQAGRELNSDKLGAREGGLAPALLTQQFFNNSRNLLPGLR